MPGLEGDKLIVALGGGIAIGLAANHMLSSQVPSTQLISEGVGAVGLAYLLLQVRFSSESHCSVIRVDQSGWMMVGVELVVE